MKHHIVRNFCSFIVMLMFSTLTIAATNQTSFASPEAAVKALIATIKEDDTNKLIQILGADAKPLLESGDPVEDQTNREKFLKAYEEANKLEKASDTKYLLTLGKDEWPFPIPLVKEANGWYFDTAAGKEEILNRRIGRNELSTIQAVLAYVDAQRDYYLTDPDGNKLFSFADKFLSTPGKRDGLYYPVKENEPSSPLGEAYAKARAAGYGEKKTESGQQPYYGYYYRILKSQGPAAPGGAHDYLIQGQMVGGHALIAWPANYGNTGVMTFIVNQDGVVYEKDLGADTNEVAQQIMNFNPDKTWKAVKER